MEASIDRLQRSTDELRVHIEKSTQLFRRYRRLKSRIEQSKRHIKDKELWLLDRKRRLEEATHLVEVKREQCGQKSDDQRGMNDWVALKPLKIGEVEVLVAQSRIIYQGSQNQLDRRRAELATTIATIFPIEMIDAENMEWGICNLPCNYRNIRARQQGIQVAAAFGLIAQVLALLSKYLNIPLQYPVQPRSSQSIIYSPPALVTSMAPYRRFPLFPTRGVDKPRYEYATQLLETDLEQLLLAYGIQVADRQRILPNLKQLLIAIAAWPSRA
ncbi:hypothetical protein EV182_001017 [Spiromyces aspiralis]|uniref:Uncharacterized protein n=1 Tax=Spiromyces aspiralis TaxID=68401 RepID=A0ACC1HWA3_9FUNG|nr:hypothetical protein EV182_001017 [Spiromyces aspiralis]